MRRLIGKGRKKPPVKTLDETSKRYEERIEIEGKEEAINKKLRKLKLEMNKLPKGSPARKQKEKRAKMLLKQRRMYQEQGDLTRNQQANIDMQNYNLDSMENSVETMRTMKVTKKTMGQRMKKVQIDKTTDVKDDIDDYMQDHYEVQEVLASNPRMDDIDEVDLEGELSALDEFEDDGIMVNETRQYVQESNFAIDLPVPPKGGLDKFGLPSAPVPVPKKDDPIAI